MLSVDPGVEHCGFALWDDGELQRAWLHTCVNGHAHVASLGFPQNVPGPPYPAIDSVVVERPQVYPGFKLRGDPNDLVAVAIVGAEVVGQIFVNWGEDVEVSYVYPKKWKGNLPKDEYQLRIAEALSETERSLIELPRAKALAHNIYDSIGIGLWKLDRLERGVSKKAKKTA